MNWRPKPARLIVVGLGAGWLAACGSSPTGPSAAPPSSRAVSMTITGLSGPLIAGQPVPLTARVTLADGTQKIAADAQWQSADSTIVAVSSTGVVKAVGRGATDVVATSAGATANVHVAVATPSVRLTQTIDHHNSTAALSGITKVMFDLSASTGGGLEYSLSFGDSTPDATGAVVEHVFSSPGTYTVVGRVTDLIGQVDITSRAVLVTSLPALSYSLGWQNSGVNPTTGQYESRTLIFATQVGHNVTGTYQSSSGFQLGLRPFTGTVTDTNDVELALTDGTIRMVGYVEVGSKEAMQLTMHGGSADGLLLVFRPSFY